MESDFESHMDLPLNERCYYQPMSGGGRYWHENDAGRWVFKNGTQFTRWLKSKGLSDDLQGGQVLTAVEKLLTELETDRLVDYAGGLAGYQSGIMEMNKNRILVTRSTELIEFKSPDFEGEPPDVMDFEAWGWPMLGKFLTGLFNGIERDGDGDEVVEQLTRFLDWHWHFMDSLYRGHYSTGMALALAGEPGCGKTLLSSLIQEMSGGIVARPYRYMVGQDNFNEEFLEAPLLLVDDENSDTQITSRLKFGSELKQIVATRGTRIRAMHQKAMVLNPIQRLVICVNLEPERLQVLPPIDKDISDKIMILKGYTKTLPMPMKTLTDQEAFWRKLMEELPYYVHWITNIYQPSLEGFGRFGPPAWQHPAIIEELGRLNPETRTYEFLMRFLGPPCSPKITKSDFENIAAKDRKILAKHMKDGQMFGFIGTASDLRSRLVADGDVAPLSGMERREVRAVAYLGRDLAALSRQYPTTIWATRPPANGGRYWIILNSSLPDESDSVTEPVTEEK